MTYQSRDIIFFNGSEHVLSAEPLGTYAAMPTFMGIGTNNHRGYTAVWAVVADKLFLVSLDGHAKGAAEPGIRSVYPTAEAPVLAEWFSGELMLQSGRLLHRSDIDPIYEYETALVISQGRVCRAKKLPLRPAPAIPYSVRELEGVVPVSTLKSLEAASIRTIGDLIALSAPEVQAKAQMSPDTLRELLTGMATAGLEFWPRGR
ncbi:hypothetical protein [Variovorax sp. JS1663]|uniref:hypothetical protein n=1 Tax=Variovorax sp. JS1663 TaxID=1851577 RepID=UPI000B34604B|nr:hypothetical protein [Variovorax sp. JS1663]OUM02970.1 hypothetical protein A8M77_08495 [Variovorax sp. JS1663]